MAKDCEKTAKTFRVYASLAYSQLELILVQLSNFIKAS